MNNVTASNPASKSSRGYEESKALRDRCPGDEGTRDPSDVTDGTLSELLFRGLAGDEICSASTGGSLARGCLESVAIELRTLHALLSHALKTELPGGELGPIDSYLWNLALRCESAAELDRRTHRANAASKPMDGDGGKHATALGERHGEILFGFADRIRLDLDRLHVAVVGMRSESPPQCAAGMEPKAELALSAIQELGETVACMRMQSDDWKA